MVHPGAAAGLIRALGALAEALALPLRVRGLRSAQTLLSARLGLDLAGLPPEGQILPLGELRAAPVGALHTPQLWKPRMRRAGAPALTELPMLNRPPLAAPVPGGDD